MKERFKEKIIEISSGKYLNRIFAIVLILCMLALLVLVKTLNVSNSIRITLGIVLLVGVFIWECFNAIAEYPKDVATKNKLVNIILSCDRVWDFIILWIIAAPIFAVIDIHLSFWGGILFIIIMVFILIKLSKYLSTYFKNKIIK